MCPIYKTHTKNSRFFKYKQVKLYLQKSGFIFTKGSGLKENQGNFLQNSQLSNELHKPIIRKFKKRKVYSSFKDNIWGVDLADMQLISKHNQGVRYILCVIDLFSKYAWVVPLK